MKQLVLKLTGYHITGTADVTQWGGGNASIEMEPFNIQHIRELRNGINDSGFGVESINGAVCDIYRNYEGTHVYSRTLLIGSISSCTLECYYH